MKKNIIIVLEIIIIVLIFILLTKIDNQTFNLIKKNNQPNTFNEFGGEYLFQIWKYDPSFINRISQSAYDKVDPISLFLTYKEDQDERVQMELEHLINRFIW